MYQYLCVTQRRILDIEGTGVLIRINCCVVYDVMTNRIFCCRRCIRIKVNRIDRIFKQTNTICFPNVALLTSPTLELRILINSHHKIVL